MRIYYFSPETGIYQGEGFVEGDELDSAEGVTDVVPPPYGKEEVPVFCLSSRTWSVVEVRQLLGRPAQ